MDLIMNDPAWKNGNYNAPFAGVTSIELADLVLTTPEYFDAHTDRDQIFQQIDNAAKAGAASVRHDANDKIRTTQAMLRFDLSAQFGGSMAEAASAVHAHTHRCFKI